MKADYKYFSSNFFKINMQNALIGIGVGIIISVVQSTFNDRFISYKNMLLNIMFSMVISLSITNSVFLYQRFLKPQKVNLWQFILVYYTCNLLGMLVGIEVSYFLVSLMFDTHYVLLGHFNDYKFTFIIVLIVGTVIYREA